MSSFHRWYLASAALVAVSAASVPAQELLWEQRGVSGQVNIGSCSAFVGDIDGDGFEDLVSKAGGLVPIESQLHVRSGRDGSLLRVDRPVLGRGHAVRRLVSVGDMDGDGVRDYAFSSLETQFNPFLSSIEVRSAVTGSLLWQVTASFGDLLGDCLAGEIDLDGDGRPDLVASAPGDNGGLGALHAYDNSGQLLYKWLGIVSSLGTLRGDMDGDGVDDFLRGGPSENSAGGVFVHSGRTGQILRAGFGEMFGDGLGIGRVTGCGDIDGDGTLDFAGSSGGFGGPGLVRVFSGAGPEPLYTWRRPAGSLYGDEMVAADLDLDGIDDLLIGPVTCTAIPTTSALEWRSLRSGEQISQLCAPDPTAGNFGFEPSVVGGPQPGHPFPVLIVGEPLFREQPSQLQGRILCYRAAPTNVQPLGAACAGTTSRAPRLGFADRGASGALVHLSEAPPGASAALLLGVSDTSWAGQPLPWSLDNFGLPGCSLQTSVEATVPTVTGIQGTSFGYAGFTVPLPLNAGLGADVHAQWVVLGAGVTPVAFTGGLSWRH